MADFWSKVEGGCSIPVFGYATIHGDQLRLDAGLASFDGKTILRRTEKAHVDDPAKLGDLVAQFILANEGRELLKESRRQQEQESS